MEKNRHDQAKEECKYALDGSCENCSLPEGETCPYEETAGMEKTDALAAPSDYTVIIHNDNYTPHQFVTIILHDIFNKTNEDALKIANEAAAKGKTVVGTYIYDIGLSKIINAMGIAKDMGFPLKLSLEENKSEIL